MVGVVGPPIPEACCSSPLTPDSYNQNHANWDFVSDTLANIRQFECLVVVDDSSRECVDTAVDRSIGGVYVGSGGLLPWRSWRRLHALWSEVHQLGVHRLDPKTRHRTFADRNG